MLNQDMPNFARRRFFSYKQEDEDEEIQIETLD